MSSLSDINRIAEQVLEGSSGENRAAPASPISSYSLLAPIAICLQIVVEIEYGLKPKILSEDMSDLLCFYLVDVQLSVLMVVAERHNPAHHIPFFFEAATLSRMRSPVTSRSN